MFGLKKSLLVIGITMLVVGSLSFACGGGADSITVYSGRSKTLVQPVLDKFSEETGIKVQVNYASTSQVTATILEEGDRSPADVVFLQDPGFLGVLSSEGKLSVLPDDILSSVDDGYRAGNGEWVGTSGRARTVVYNTANVNPEVDLPPSILGFTDPKWKGRIGWAPQNASFQAFVTGMRVLLGDDEARNWLEGIQANEARSYPNNTTTVQAAANGEIDVGFVNHYYLHRFLESEGEGFGARNHYIGNGDPGALLMTAGAGILRTSDDIQQGERLIRFLLSPESQEYFAKETFEYPLAAHYPDQEALLPLDELDPPDIDLSDLSDARGTLDLLRSTGILP